MYGCGLGPLGCQGTAGGEELMGRLYSHAAKGRTVQSKNGQSCLAYLAWILA